MYSLFVLHINTFNFRSLDMGMGCSPVVEYLPTVHMPLISGLEVPFLNPKGTYNKM